MYPRLSTDPATLPNASSGGRFWVPDNVPALAAADGVVEKVGWGATGGYVHVRHSSTVVTAYRHLSKLFVDVGARVKAGTALGVVGEDPSNAGDPLHLHFELLLGGVAADPASALTQASLLTPQGAPASRQGLWVGLGVAALVGGSLALLARR